MIVGVFVILLRMTCQIRMHNDLRSQLVSQGHRYVYGTFHAHQIGGLMAAEPGTGAIVSRSDDGEIVVPVLLWSGHVPIRGSSGMGREGGATALQSLIKHVLNGSGAMLAVDGPRGSPGSVQKGIGLLLAKNDAAVLMAVAVPSKRWIFSRTWDRFQLPKPFCRIDLYLSDPLFPRRVSRWSVSPSASNRCCENWRQSAIRRKSRLASRSQHESLGTARRPSRTDTTRAATSLL